MVHWKPILSKTKTYLSCIYGTIVIDDIEAKGQGISCHGNDHDLLQYSGINTKSVNLT